MATEFPHVYFVGFDHGETLFHCFFAYLICLFKVPIATRYPPSNLRFEIENVHANYHWSDESFDLVHARGINLAVRL
jgi:hypothetical protein